MMDEGRTHPIDLDCVPVSLPTDKAVSVGIIATELVTNAHKYAYPTHQGSICVSVTKNGEDVVLTVDDDGIGLQDVTAASGTGLGSKVIASMTSRLQGAISHPKTLRGTRVVLQFPL